MVATVHRMEWRAVARLRVRESRALLAASEWSGAYYLSGYGVECALKAVLARGFKAGTIPQKKLVQDVYTHNLASLISIAGLAGSLRTEETSDPLFAAHWAVVKDWNEASRYATWSRAEAEDLVAAITDRRHGVMKWVRRHW